MTDYEFDESEFDPEAEEELLDELLADDDPWSALVEDDYEPEPFDSLDYERDAEFNAYEAMGAGWDDVD